MSRVATTRLSSKGQVVIPEEIRERLGLEPGVQFVVVGEEDVVVLKTLDGPSMSQFDQLIREARSNAQAVGLTPEDIEAAIADGQREK